MVRADVDVVECALAEVVLAEAKHVVLVARVRISFFTRSMPTANANG